MNLYPGAMYYKQSLIKSYFNHEHEKTTPPKIYMLRSIPNIHNNKNQNYEQRSRQQRVTCHETGPPSVTFTCLRRQKRSLMYRNKIPIVPERTRNHVSPCHLFVLSFPCMKTFKYYIFLIIYLTLFIASVFTHQQAILRINLCVLVN